MVFDGGGYRGPKDADIINGRHIRPEKPKIPLANRAGLEILIEQRENVGLESPVWHERRAGAGRHVTHEVPIILGRAGGVHANLGLVSIRGPTRFGYHNLKVRKAQTVHSGENRVQLGVQHVGVLELGVVIKHARVGPKERVVEGLGGAAEERVRIDHERRVCGSEKA